VAIVGGGETALAEALCLAQIAKKVYLIHRRDQFRASEATQKKVFSQPKIEILWNKTVADILGEKKLEKMVLEDILDGKRREIDLDGLFLAIGQMPNTDFLGKELQLDEQGFIRVKDNVFTSAEGVFAAGDVVDPVYRQLSVATGLGCMAAIRAIEYIKSRI